MILIRIPLRLIGLFIGLTAMVLARSLIHLIKFLVCP